MKPLQLTMRAFGAYAGEQIIDFTLLGDKNFFLIHGPTGSGKTTILDAISFALYGSASGDLRESKNLRSDYAPAEQKTDRNELFRSEFFIWDENYCLEALSVSRSLAEDHRNRTGSRNKQRQRNEGERTVRSRRRRGFILRRGFGHRRRFILRGG